MLTINGEIMSILAIIVGSGIWIADYLDRKRRA